MVEDLLLQTGLKNARFNTGLVPGEQSPPLLLSCCSWGRSRALGFALPVWKGWSCLLASYSVLYGGGKMWMSLCGLKWTLLTAKCSDDSGSWWVLLWPHLSEICAPAAVSVCSANLQALLAMSLKAKRPCRHPVTKLWGLLCPGAGGGLGSAFHTGAADGGRRRLLTVPLSFNLGTAVLKSLLVSFDLRPPTAKLWLPNSWQVPFKPSLILCAFWYLSQHVQF